MQLMFDLNATFLNYSTINNNCNVYDKQEYCTTTKSQICHKMSPNKIIAQSTLEVWFMIIILIMIIMYFLAMICDLKVDPKMRRRFGLRYTDTPGIISDF
ncbi:unnamed protein product [Brugia pahangi]|uniref:Ion_trans domain-containing protein n=1 Tax=Brugia pahangi TaxID=6280 RepID=A0A0N4TCH1_BRUPA|nr:unnamed protein product [Brugia pahangi]